VKKSAKVIIERYYPKLTLDFETNKRLCDEIAIIASKRLRNKVRSGFAHGVFFFFHFAFMARVCAREGDCSSVYIKQKKVLVWI
jgi:ribosomal S17-like protein